MSTAYRSSESAYYARKSSGALSVAQLRDAYDAPAVYQAFERNHGLYGVRKCGTRCGVMATKWAAIKSDD